MFISPLALFPWLFCSALFGVWAGRRYRSVLFGIASALVFALCWDVATARLGLVKFADSDDQQREMLSVDDPRSRPD
jgi:hypothetical protein